MSGTVDRGPESRTLRERVTAPATVELPTVGVGIVWRPVTVADIDPILDLKRVAGKVDHPRVTQTRDEIEEEFASDNFDPERDAVIGVDSTGRAVAYASAEAPESVETLACVELDAAVAPDRRGEGLGSALLAWQEARGLQHLAACDTTAPGWLMSMTHEHAHSTIRLLETHGYDRARWWLELELDLDTPIAEPPSPPDVRLVPYGPQWQEETRSARNDAFRDHWGSPPITAEDWASADRLSASRPDLSLLAVTTADDGERVDGFVLVDVDEDEWPLRDGPFGYITTVGTRRAARGRGLARTLMAHVLRRMRADGLRRAVLEVDADSPTGALGLYQSFGFTVGDRSVSLVKRF